MVVWVHAGVLLEAESTLVAFQPSPARRQNKSKFTSCTAVDAKTRQGDDVDRPWDVCIRFERQCATPAAETRLFLFARGGHEP